MNPGCNWIPRHFHWTTIAVFGNQTHRACSHTVSGMDGIRSGCPARKVVTWIGRVNGWGVPHEARFHLLSRPSMGYLNSCVVAND